ncbi:MAG TPA: AMIN domain-containing protein, partial [Candidatus Methylomirabilis sp.]
METRVSAGLPWRGPLLGAAALVLAACAAEMAGVQPVPSSTPPPAPATPSVAAPVPAPVQVPAPTPPAPPAVAAAPSPAPPPPAPSRPIEVTAVDAQEAGTGGLILAVAADGPIATYESFTLSDPPRLIVDIPNATHAIPQPIAARPPMVTAIRSSQYRERPVKMVRVVLDLRATVPYQITTVDNQLRVQLGTTAGAAPGAPGAAAVPTGKVTRVDLQS